MEQLVSTMNRLAEVMLQQQESHVSPVKMNPYVEGENIEDFLLAFEQSMEIQDVDRRRWPAQLMSVVTGKHERLQQEYLPERIPRVQDGYIGSLWSITRS